MRNKYIFILTITIFSSLFLSLASEGFKEMKKKNVEIDKKKNILSAIGVTIDNFSIDFLNQIYYLIWQYLFFQFYQKSIPLLV